MKSPEPQAWINNLKNDIEYTLKIINILKTFERNQILKY
jgi:hypothetical protein